MLQTKQVVIITHNILLILAAAFSTNALVYNTMVNSFQKCIYQWCSMGESVVKGQQQRRQQQWYTKQLTRLSS